MTEGDSPNAGWRPAVHGTDSRPLRGRVARGLTWTIADNWGRQVLNLLVFVILANLLEPEDFGLVALAVVFVSFAQVFVDQGLGDALIQRPHITRSHIDTAFWIAITTGAGLTLIGLLLAIPIAIVLRQPELTPILQVLSLSFVFSAMSSIQIALLRRELAFRSLAIRSILSTIAGGVVGVAMAYAGYGAWALVGQLVATAVVSVLALWWVLPWRPSRHFSRSAFHELFGFGANVVGNDIVTFFTRNTDNLLIGSFLGTTPLGFYAVGYRILGTSQMLLVNISRKLAFPALATLQHDPERLKGAYFRLTRTAGALILPTYLWLALVGQELTLVLFGQRWAATGPVAAVLFLSGPVLTVQAFSFPLLYAVGHPEVALRFRLLTMLTMVAAFLIALPSGIVAVAGAFVISGYVLLPLNLHWQRIYAGIPTLEYLRQLRGVAVATATMMLVIAAAKFALGTTLGPALLLGVEAVVAGLSYGLALWLFDRRLLFDALGVARQALPFVGAAFGRIKRTSAGQRAARRDSRPAE